jgi:hypothetical protein
LGSVYRLRSWSTGLGFDQIDQIDELIELIALVESILGKLTDSKAAPLITAKGCAD